MEKVCRKKETIVLTILFAGYLLFNGILLAGHELWRDEANVWLVAREMSILQLFREIRYQGHPCLWYLIVMPFAKAGFPFKTISVLSCLVMAAAAGIFAYRAPFHPVTKLVCLISPIFSYYYPVVARNYCLIAVLLILLAACHSKRNENPIGYGLLLGALVQADTIALAAAGLISLMWLWESISKTIREKSRMPILTSIKGLWIPLFSLFLWIAEFYHVSDSPEFQFRRMSGLELIGEIRNFFFHILSRMTGGGKGFDLLLLLLFLAAGVFISLRLKNIWPAVVMAGAFLFEIVFSIMIYQLHIWHYIAIAFTLIWFLWLGNEPWQEENGQEKEKLKIVRRGLSEGMLILLSCSMFLRWNSPEESSSLSNALHGLYSDGVNVAAYIKENIAPEELVFSTDVSESATVQAYLGKDYTFYYAGNQKPEVYADYAKEQQSTVSYEELWNFVWDNFPEKDSFYILESPGNCIKDIPDEIKDEFTVCYRTEGKSARGEDYVLYRIRLGKKQESYG